MQVNCLNCTTTYDGNFCPHCGQKKNTHRVTFEAILHDIPHSVLHIDKGLFFTFYQMLFKPGKVISNYLAGKRVNYFSPFAYLFLLSAVSSFLEHLARRGHSDEMTSIMLFPALAHFFNHYPALMLCSLIPFISFWSWMFNMDTGYNYWENFILNTYIIAEFNLLFIFWSVIDWLHLRHSPSVTPLLIAAVFYMVFAYLQFFHRGLSFMRVIRNTAMFLLIALTLITCLSITGFMTPWWNMH